MTDITDIINELATRTFDENDVDETIKDWSYNDIIAFKHTLKTLNGDKTTDFMKLMNGIGFLSYVAFNVPKCLEFGVEKGLSWKAIKSEIENDWIDGQNGLILNLYNLCPIIINGEELYSKTEKDEWSEEDLTKLNLQGYNNYLITDDFKKIEDWYVLYKYPIRRKAQ